MKGKGPARLGPFRQEYERNKKKILMSQDACGICGKPVDKSLPGTDPWGPTIDHIIPIAKGGHPADIANLQLAHRACNRQKSDRVLAGQRENNLLYSFEEIMRAAHEQAEKKAD